MNRIIIVILFALAFIQVRSQGALPLPYSGPNVCLDRVVPIGSGTHTPKNMVVKDFDNDSFLDVLVADCISGRVDIYQTVSGTLVATQVLTIQGTGQFNSIDAGFIDNDPFIDLITTDTMSMIKIYKNTSTGPGSFSFSSTPVFMLSMPATCLSRPSYIKAADLNNDALDDIILAAPSTTAAFGLALTIFRNQFTAPAAYNFAVDYTRQAFASPGNTVTPAALPLSVLHPSMDISYGDYSGDGYHDILITYTMQKDSVLFLKSAVTGVGAPLVYQPVAKRAPSFLNNWSVQFFNCEMADVDGSPGADALCLISAFQSPTTVNGIAIVSATDILAPSPTPNLYENITFSGTSVPNDFKVADIDNDGNKDVICINNTELWIYFGTPPPTPFLNGLTFSIAINPAAEVAIGNFDKNTLPDILFKPWLTPGNTNMIPNFHYSVSAVSGNSAICTGGTASASVIITPSLNMNHTVDWYSVPTGTTPVFTGTTNPVFTTTSTGVYFPKLNIPFPNTPGQTCVIKNYPKDSIVVVSAANPSLNVNPSVQTICSNSSAVITASNVLSGNYTFTWTSGGTTLTSSPGLTTSASGTFTVFGTNLLNNCIGSQTATVNLYPPDQSNINSSKAKVCPGDSTSLSITAQSYTWSTGSHTSQIYVKPAVNTNYSVTITDLNGCVSSKSIQVVIDSCIIVKDTKIQIFNLVTPNSDHSNDVFTIENIDLYPGNSVEIFNRWGQKIFSTKGYDNVSNSWPAQNSNNVNSTYYYVVDLGDGSQKHKGWLELIN